MTEITRGQLWIPDNNYALSEEYPTATVGQLQERWADYMPDAVMIEAPGVLGTIRQPETPPTAYASIDLCEVVRETRHSLHRVTDIEPKAFTSIHEYGEGTSFSSTLDVVSVVQVLMNNGLITPIEDINEIGNILRSWRQQGVYVMANTSTLQGCELSTIDFFKKYLPDCFDGILLPRNHDGTAPLTKGVAVRQVIETLSPYTNDITALHIDDSPHHNASFTHEVGEVLGAKTTTFLPKYPTHLDTANMGSIVTPTPLAAFQEANKFLQVGRQSDRPQPMSDVA